MSSSQAAISIFTLKVFDASFKRNVFCAERFVEAKRKNAVNKIIFFINCLINTCWILNRIPLQLHSTDRFLESFCIKDSEFFFMENQMNNTYSNTFGNFSAADALPEERAAFIRKTYLHLAGAVLVFIALEAYIFMSGAAVAIAETIGGGGVSWLLVLAVFMGISFLANRWANSQTSKPLQYLGLATLIIAYGIIFVPLLYVAAYYGGVDVFLKAGVVSLGLFLGLTAVVFLTRKDFSFLGPILMIGGFVALGFIASGIIFGFSLGSVFAFAMVAFAGAAILYDTSNILHRYNTNQHVAASLALFASVALLFWYILQIFMGGGDD
jgi:FtsH-binding integral membrane protein